MKKLFFLVVLLGNIASYAQGPYTIPYSTDFETYSTEEAFLIDWTYENTQISSSVGIWLFDYTAYFGYNTSNCIIYGTSSIENGDDWIFSPAFTLQAGTQYELRFLAANGYSTGSENVKIYIGTDTVSTAMSTLIADFTGITGTIFTEKTISFSVSSSGTYHIGFFDYSAMQNYSMLLIDNFTIEIATGIEENQEPLTLYPNPTSSLIHCTNQNEVTIRVLNTAGVELMVLKNATPNTSIDMSSLDDGTYFIQIIDENTIITKQFVLQK